MHLAPQGSQDEDLFLEVNQMRSGAEPAPPVEDPMDDVFGSDSEPPEDLTAREDHTPDIRRLQTQHATEGYREGITTAKATSIQAGFDEGFSLGATIGQKAGQLLGLLEGIAEALGSADIADSRRAHQLLEDARKELSTDAIFNEQYWASDGIWKYDVGDSKDEKTVVFEDVASAHPLVLKWSETINKEILRWNIDREILNTPQETSHENAPERKEVKHSQQLSHEVLEW